MRVRKLETKDAPFMLEWMHDEQVVKNMQVDFMNKTLADCEAFIRRKESSNIHLAITDENDMYIGTVSLKNIENGQAEFAIAIRRSAMGKGYSKYGMSEILRMGFNELGLERIYWYVSLENKRAIRFYDKNGYKRTDAASLNIMEDQAYIWYEVTV